MPSHWPYLLYWRRCTPVSKLSDRSGPRFGYQFCVSPPWGSQICGMVWSAATLFILCHDHGLTTFPYELLMACLCSFETGDEGSTTLCEKLLFERRGVNQDIDRAMKNGSNCALVDEWRLSATEEWVDSILEKLPLSKRIIWYHLFDTIFYGTSKWKSTTKKAFFSSFHLHWSQVACNSYQRVKLQRPLKFWDVCLMRVAKSENQKIATVDNKSINWDGFEAILKYSYHHAKEDFSWGSSR